MGSMGGGRGGGWLWVGAEVVWGAGAEVVWGPYQIRGQTNSVKNFLQGSPNTSASLNVVLKAYQTLGLNKHTAVSPSRLTRETGLNLSLFSS